jgi:2-furoate---CoA ligase
MDLGTALRWTAERHPHHRAVGGDDPLTYAQWEARANCLARALAQLGVRPKDRLALLLSGGEPMASLHLAAQKLGAVSVPLSVRFGADELAHCLRDSAPALLVTDSGTAELAERALGGEPVPPRAHSGPAGDAPSGTAPLDPLAQRQSDSPVDASVSDDDLSVVLYTSGTTSMPKGVPRTHRAEHQAAVAHLLQTRQAPFEVSLGAMPLFHTMGLRSLLASVIASGTWVPQARFDPEETLRLITAERISALYLVPTAYWGLLRTGRLGEARCARKLAYAGAAMTPALAEQLADALEPGVFVNHFGSTEIYTFTIGPDVLAKPGCAGRPGIFSRVRLVEIDPLASPEQVVGPGEHGQIAVSMDSPEAFTGYWQRPEADARTIREGWYFPGDLGVRDEDGDLWVSGRIDDMINSGGENIHPDEVERALARCSAVGEVVVAGIPDERWGQAATAFFVPGPGWSPEQAVVELARFARHDAGLPSLKRPKRLVVVDQVPKSGVGKLLRRELITGNYEPLAETTLGG